MSRTIKAKSTKQQTPFLVWSKGQHIAFEKRNKKREFLNNFVDKIEDLDYDFEFQEYVDLQFCSWNTNQLFPSYRGPMRYGKYIKRTPVKKYFPLCDEIEQDYSETINKDNGDYGHVGTYDYDHDREIESYIGAGKYSSEVKFLYQFSYLPEGRFEYFFGKNVDFNDVPNWAIAARLWGITPNLIAEKAGISKKLAREIYSQYEFNWTEFFPTSLAARYQDFKERMPSYIEDIRNCLPEDLYDNIVALYKKNPDSFEKKEIIREHGRTFELESNGSRIFYAISNMRNSISNFPKFSNVHKAVIWFESLMTEDKEMDEDFPIIPEGFVSCTSNPRKIFFLGSKFHNCLRYRCVRWDDTDGFVLEHEDGFLLHTSRNCIFPNIWEENESKRRFNVSVNYQDREKIAEFFKLNNPETEE